MNNSSPSADPGQASALQASAQSTAASKDVGTAVLPCQAWTLEVTVKSTVPFFPKETVTVSASITAGGVGYSSAGTQMAAVESPPVVFKGGGDLTYALQARSGEKWVSAGAATASMVPSPNPFKATVLIKPKKPWAIVKLVNSVDDSMIPQFAVGLTLGANKKAGTTAKENPTLFDELETAEDDGQFRTVGNATKFDVGSVEHPDVVWEFVSIATA